MAMRVCFMRHGQSNYNLKRLCNDDPRKDVHLTPLGRKQAEEVAEKLRDRGFEVVFISEFPRSRETAEIVNRYHNAPVRVDSRINDRKTGLEGRTFSEFLKALGTDIFNSRLEGGESFREEKRRVCSFLRDLKGMDYGSVLVVTHGEIMKVINGYFRKLSDRDAWSVKVGNCQVMEFDA
jgi:alpha-ribazole phosphatase